VGHATWLEAERVDYGITRVTARRLRSRQTAEVSRTTKLSVGRSATRKLFRLVRDAK